MDYIDVHAHGFPEAYLRQLAATYPTEVQVEEAAGTTPMVTRWSKAPLPAWDLERHLEEMDRDGVAVEILSAPPVYSHLDAHTAGFCRLLNDFQAGVAQAAPGRFRSFLHLPRTTSRPPYKNSPAGVVGAKRLGCSLGRT